MKILALETSSPACSVSLLDTEKPADQSMQFIHEIAPMQHTQLILPMIQKLLAAANISINEVDGIAYGCGPGSFTGVRIASSVAQGLSFAAKCPVVAVSSLAVLAQAAYLSHQWPRLLVVVDAKMGQVYWAYYEVDDQGCVVLNGDEQLTKPEAVKVPNDYYGVGDGWGLLQCEQIKTDPKQLPTAEALALLSRIKFEQGESMAATDAVPVYLSKS